MKSFKWLLILFIGMISLTGFSSTTDLTKNSCEVFFANNDVGILNASIVENIKLELINFQSLNNNASRHLEVFKFNYSEFHKDVYNKPLYLPLLVPWQSNKYFYNNKTIQNYKAREKL